MLNWLKRLSKNVLNIIWLPFSILLNFIWYCIKGKTKKGNIVRQSIGIVLLSITSLFYIYAKPANIAVDYLNSRIEKLSNWEQLPFKQRGFDQWLAQREVSKLPDNTFILGLDLQGGVRVVYDVDLSGVSESDKSQALDSLQKVVTKRVDSFGVSEPRIYLEEGDTVRLVVELAGIENPEEAVKQIGQTPNLTFYQARPAEETKQLLEQFKTGNFEKFQNPYFIEPAVLTGKNIKTAEVVFDTQTQQPQVGVSFDDEGKKRFAEFTKNNIGEILYILLDGDIISAPRINQEIPNGQATISGDFTATSAKELVDGLNAGALPVPITITSQQTVEASLGIESLYQSIKAGAVGLLLVAIFMIVFYRALGVVAVFALAIYSILVLAIFNLFGFTLTIAGITGFIVSIGLAVDGNVLIFERMKEELKSGRDFDASTQEGFRRAWESIRDSQVTTLISALILFYLASGVVRGFGLTLVIGIVVSLFTAITVSRLFVTLLGYQKWLLGTKFGKFITLQK
jgi:preprotein translocase subunit SecD